MEGSIHRFHILLHFKFQSADEMSVDEDSKDDERTLDEQEGHEDENDTKVDEEIAALEEEADLPLEDLLSK